MQRNRKIIGRLLRFFAAIASGLILILVTTQLVLWGGLFWLRSAAGTDWLKSTLSTLAAKSGYTIEVQDIKGPTLSGMNAGSLRISDKDGPFLDARQIDLRIDIFSLLTKSLSLSATAESLSLQRLPEAGQAAPSSVHDIYFNSISLDRLKIGKLFLAENIIGREITAAAELSMQAKKQDGNLALDLSLRADPETDATLPERAELNAVFSPITGRLVIGSLSLTSPLYTINGKGAVSSGGGRLDLELHGTSALPSGLRGVLQAKAHITGTMDKPAIEATGMISLADYKERGLEDIHFKVIADGALEGHVEARTAYRENSITLGGGFLYVENILHIKEIHGTAPEATLAGALDFNTDTGIADGNIYASINFGRYKDLLEMDISGNGSAHLILSSAQGRQAGSVVLNNFSIAALEIDTLKLNVALAEREFYTFSTEGTGKYKKPFTWSGAVHVSGNSPETAVVRNIALSVRPTNGTIYITGEAAQKAADLSIRLNGVPLNALPLSGPDRLGSAKISGLVLIKGALADPAIEADLDFSHVQAIKNTDPVTMHLTADYADQKLVADITATGKGIKTLRAHGEIPLTLSLYPFQTSNISDSKLQADISADLELGNIAAAFLGKGMRLGGRLKADVKTVGTPGAPQVTGKISLTDGVFTQVADGLAFEKIDMRGTLDKGILEIETLSARDGKSGKITARGQIDFAKAYRPVTFSIQGDNFNPFRNSDLISGSFDGDVDLSGDSRGYTAKGRITTQRLNITIPARFNSDIPSLNIVSRGQEAAEELDYMEKINLNLDLVANRRVFVYGWGLDAEFGGAAKVSGTLAEPLFNGVFESKRGRYEEFGKRFDIQHARLRFEGTVPPSPYLDVLTETRAQGIAAQISLTGNISKPAVHLTSIPPLPQDEVLSHLLFGRDIAKITPFQAIQLANTLQRFSGNGDGGFAPLSVFRKLTGFDDLQIGKDEKGGTVVGAGKYITDKVYLEAEAGSGENSGAAKVKIDLTPHVKAESKIGQGNKTGGGIFWQWDY